MQTISMENGKTEYKKGLGAINEILETTVAFSNTSGGEILIGIDDSGKISGITIGNNTLENLAATIGREIEPKITVSLRAVEKGELRIIVVIIPMSPLKPHFFKGVAYKRVGKANLKLSPQELEQMLTGRALSLHDVDSLQLNLSSADISTELLKIYVKETRKEYHDAKHALRSLGLTDNGGVYPSAVLFFGKDPARVFPLYGIKCAVFKGIEMLAIRDFSVPIYEAVAPVMNFIKQNLPSEIKFDGVRRYDELKVPESAIREALLNSLIHADYTLDATIYVKITEDLIEIKNGGTLPIPLTLEELVKPHISKPRNKRLAALCHRIGWIEHWGEGTLKIINEMKRRGLEAKFEEKNGYFSVKLSFKEIELNERQKKIFNRVNTLKIATIRQLAVLGIPERTIRADLSFLAKKRLLRKEGKGRRTVYRL